MTASFIISTTPISTRGASSTAKYIADEVSQGRRRLQDSYSLGAGVRAVFDELAAVADECRAVGWDGYDAAPVVDETYRSAYCFLEAMPLGTQTPTVGAEPDGHITFEWHRSARRTLSVSVSPQGDLHYSALLGPNKAYGTEVFLGDFPKSIVELIHRVLAA